MADEVTYEGKPGEYDLFIVRGDTWRQDFQYVTVDGAGVETEVDLTTAAARLQIRRTVNSDDVLLDLESPGDISLNADGDIVVVASAAVTELLDFKTGFYDLEITLGDGTVTTLLQGEITLVKDVTRD